MKKEQILSLPLSQLGLSTQTRNRLASEIKLSDSQDLNLGWGEKRRLFLEEAAKTITVQELINHWNKTFEEATTNQHTPYVDPKFSARLVELGLTHLDWVVLPSPTVKTSTLKKLGKKKLREVPITALNTLSSKALGGIAYELERRPWQVSIQDLLTIDPTSKDLHYFGLLNGNYQQSFLNTREKLLSLGFNYSDGVFLQAGTERRLAEDLQTQEKLSKAMAYRFIAIAQRRGLIGKLID